MKVQVKVNGAVYDRDVEPRTLLAYSSGKNAD